MGPISLETQWFTHRFDTVAMTALVHRNEHGRIEALRLLSSLLPRARLREEFLILSEDCGECVN